MDNPKFFKDVRIGRKFRFSVPLYGVLEFIKTGIDTACNGRWSEHFGPNDYVGEF